MLGRQVTNTLLRGPTRRLALRPATFQDLASRATISSSLRSYATPGRPRTAVGEPSRPVKRAVKRDARSADGGEAKKRVQARKASAKTKKKAAPKKPVKKVLTPEQQAKKEAKAASTKIKELKKTALKPPTTGQRVTAYNVFIGEHTRGRKVGAGQSAPEALKEANGEWKTLSPADIEHYNHLAQQQKQTQQAEYKRWVESHPPEVIQAANRARNYLKRTQPSAKGTKTRYPLIHDERAVKQPLRAYIQFSINRNASGDFRNITVAERAKLISQEWKTLNESEKQKYKDLESQDRSRYSTEYKDVFGHVPPAQQAAAAAA